MTGLMRLERPILVMVMAGLGLAGFGLLFAAATTPWHTDADAYFAELGAIQRVYFGPPPDPAAPFVDLPGEIDHDEAARRFHANQDRYRTNKWLYADLGYSAVTWAGVIGAWLLARIGHPLARAPRLRAVVMVIALSLCAGVSIIASVLHVMSRQQVPTWADSPGIPLMAVGPTMVMAFFVGIVVALPVWVRQGSRVPRQLIWPRPHWKSMLATAIYLPVLALGAWMIFYVWVEAGWIGSLTGFFLLWLALEGRAAALTPSDREA